MVQQDRYNQKAEEFLKSEIATHPIPNVYLLDQEVDAANQKITLTYGGELIPKEEEDAMKRKLPIFKLENTTLIIKQGFANLKDKEDINPLAAELLATKEQVSSIKDELKIKNANLDSVQMIRDVGGQVYRLSLIHI